MICRENAKHRTRLLPLLAAGAVLLALATPGAQARTADPAAGRRLAGIWCSNCHVVAPQPQHVAGNPTPTFSTIAQQPATSPRSLRVFLQKPHGGMPNLHLTGDETDDLVAYIVSLRHR